MTASPQDAPNGGMCDCGHPWSEHSYGAGCLHGWGDPKRLGCDCLQNAMTGQRRSAPSGGRRTAPADERALAGTSTPPADPKPLASAFHTLAGYVSADAMFDELERRAEG